MPEVILPCPACGSTDCECLVCTINADESQTIHFHMACNKCFTSGPIADDAESAKKLWDSMPRALPWTNEPPKVAGFFFAESSLDDCSKKITPIEVFSPDHWRHSDWEKKHGKLSCLLCLGGFGVCPVSRYSRFAGPIPSPID